MLLVSFYFGLLVAWQEWPLTIGPYSEWDECNSVRQWLDAQGYETDRCGLMPYPQDSIFVEETDMPEEKDA